MISRSNIIARRAELGLSQAVIADRAGISRTHYNHIERGLIPIDNVTFGTIQRIARALDIEIDDRYLDWWESYYADDYR